jgi:hypothetical protein
MGQEDGGSQVSPASTTPSPHVIAPPLPPDPGTPPVCGVPPVARPPVLDSPPVPGKPPAPPEPLDRVAAPPAPPAPENADVPPSLPPSTGFDAAPVPPCPPWPPVMDVVASTWTLASRPGTLPASGPPGRPAPLRLQPRNEKKTPGMKKTTASRCMARLLSIGGRSLADSSTRVRQSFLGCGRASSVAGSGQSMWCVLWLDPCPNLLRPRFCQGAPRPFLPTPRRAPCARVAAGPRPSATVRMSRHCKPARA